MRTVVEKVSRNWAIRRRLPAQFGGGPIFVSPSAGLRFLFRPMASADPRLLMLALEFVRPGSIVWDAGANVGLFSFAAAFLAGPKGSVLAVEPDAWLVQLLRRSATLQGDTVAPVEVLPAALAATVEVRAFCPALRARSSNYLKGYGGSQAGGSRVEESVMAVSLDWLLERRQAPDVLKIDIEGAEFEALEGARKLLASKRPILICEVSSRVSEKVGALLRASGYELLDGDLPSAQRKPLSVAPWSTLAIAKPMA